MIDHVCLIVTSLERSKSYYEKILGLESRESPTDGKLLLLENKEIHFFLLERPASKEFLALQHLSIQTDSLERKKAELIRNGICDFTQGRFDLFQYRNYQWIEWRDPDGIRLEYVELIQ
ncbi:MAG TPA: VOC family protein [Fibrobacteraceae bacterium]|nr:VOC family protein [Fibrobacteraceae bacterium]